MSVEDEARAEEEWESYAKAEGLVWDMPNSSERRAFMAGRASRTPEAADSKDLRVAESAPSDTDREALIEQASVVMQEHYLDTLSAKLSPDNHSSCICGGWSEGEMEPGWDDHLAEVLADSGLLGHATQSDCLCYGADGVTEPRCPRCADPKAMRPSQPVQVEPDERWPSHWTIDEKLEDLHARYHEQAGNMLGRDECGWERCDFWVPAKFTLSAALDAVAPVQVEVTTVDELEALPLGSVVRLAPEDSPRVDLPDGSWEQGAVAEKRPDSTGTPAWFFVGKHLGYRSHQADLLPAIVLYSPAALGGGA